MKFKTEGGAWQEDLALQNLQARSRLVTSYLVAQTLNAKGLTQKFLLVVGTGNCSEINRGYFTKYDNSSGDINFIGDLCKQDIFKLICYFAKEGSFYYLAKAGKKVNRDAFNFLEELLSAKPTAELRPEKPGSKGRADCQVRPTKKKWGFLTRIWTICSSCASKASSGSNRLQSASSSIIAGSDRQKLALKL